MCDRCRLAGAQYDLRTACAALRRAAAEAGHHAACVSPPPIANLSLQSPRAPLTTHRRVQQAGHQSEPATAEGKAALRRGEYAFLNRVVGASVDILASVDSVDFGDYPEWCAPGSLVCPCFSLCFAACVSGACSAAAVRSMWL